MEALRPGSAGPSEAPEGAHSAGGAASGAERPHGAHRDGERHHGHSHAAASRHPGDHHLLQVENLSMAFTRYDEEGGRRFATTQHQVAVLDSLSLAVHAGEVVAVVGASGAGKSVLADCLLGLFDPHATVTGRIWFDGEEQTAASLAELRGRRIALVPQSVAALDPLMRVGRQVRGTGPRAERAARKARQQELFERYGLAPETARLYPHQLSGGMARRVLLCCALMGNPQLIVADEPTVGLDLDLAVSALADFRAFADEGGGVLLITHDVELALRVADRVAVFRDGTVVEETAVASFASPELLATPYARALWHALPEHGFEAPTERAVAGGANGGRALGTADSERDDEEGPVAAPSSPARAGEDGATRASSGARGNEEGAAARKAALLVRAREEGAAGAEGREEGPC